MPIAPGATMCRRGTLHFCNRYAMTAWARSMLNFSFMAALPEESAKPFTWMMSPFLPIALPASSLKASLPLSEMV